jgi:hypothetical protein
MPYQPRYFLIQRLNVHHLRKPICQRKEATERIKTPACMSHSQPAFQKARRQIDWGGGVNQSYPSIHPIPSSALFHSIFSFHVSHATVRQRQDKDSNRLRPPSALTVTASESPEWGSPNASRKVRKQAGKKGHKSYPQSQQESKFKNKKLMGMAEILPSSSNQIRAYPTARYLSCNAVLCCCAGIRRMHPSATRVKSTVRTVKVAKLGSED